MPNTMPARRFAGRRSMWRTPRKSKRSAPRRRSYAKKRSTYRRRRSSKMTKKKILNITAVKKRDNMLCYTNSTASAQSGSTIYSTTLPAVVTGGQPVNAASTFLWCATARDGTTSTAGNLGTRFTLATRTSTTPYMIGVKEAIEIQVPTGMPWQWRRICFTYKGPLGLTYDPGTSIATETTSGWSRVTNQIAGDPGSGQQYILFEKLFKGQNTVDWNDVMTAKVDNTRVTLKYDSTCTLSSGNEDGFIRKYNRWHSMYKTLVYDDDELGGGETGRIQSTQGKSGMGDYYICDLFRARAGSATTDQLSFRPEATLYWHEK
uniref:Capsid protein n=1 Tax=Myotis mistacinus feces associated gemykolovirus TaxID=3139996 RepID=A0AAU6S578_9VIRU